MAHYNASLASIIRTAIQALYRTDKPKQRQSRLADSYTRDARGRFERDTGSVNPNSRQHTDALDVDNNGSRQERRGLGGPDGQAKLPGMK
jgi:hypothetical protein